jgi:hypothetical protein
MTSVPYVITQPVAAGKTLTDGVDTLIVTAQDTTQATLLAQAAYDGDSHGLWNGTPATIAAAADFTGFTVQANIVDPTHVAAGISVEYTGVSGDDWADLMTGIVAALNATAAIANASYGGTRTLTLSSIADGIGTRRVAVKFFAPNGADLSAGYCGTVVDEGIAGAALTQQFNDVLTIVPTVVGVYG